MLRASRIAVQEVARYLSEHNDIIDGARSKTCDHSEVVVVMEAAIERACNEIFDASRKHRDHAGMGSTIVALLFVGDSKEKY